MIKKNNNIIKNISTVHELVADNNLQVIMNIQVLQVFQFSVTLSMTT